MQGFVFYVEDFESKISIPVNMVLFNPFIFIII